MSSACAICLDDDEETFSSLPCGHIFHSKCVKEWHDNGGSYLRFGGQYKAECPTCRQLFSEAEIRRVFLPSINASEQRPTTSTNADKSNSNKTADNKKEESKKIVKKRLYVKFYDLDACEDDLYEYFEQYVQGIKNISICRKGNGESKGFGFISFWHVTDAKFVLDNLNGKYWHGHPMIIQEARPKTELNNQPVDHELGRKIFVSNISTNISIATIKSHFLAYGNIDDAKLFDKKPNAKGNCALLVFTSSQSAKRAIEQANGTSVWGRRIFVKEGRARTFVQDKKPPTVVLANAFSIRPPTPPRPVTKPEVSPVRLVVTPLRPVVVPARPVVAPAEHPIVTPVPQVKKVAPPVPQVAIQVSTPAARSTETPFYRTTQINMSYRTSSGSQPVTTSTTTQRTVNITVNKPATVSQTTSSSYNSGFASTRPSSVYQSAAYPSYYNNNNQSTTSSRVNEPLSYNYHHTSNYSTIDKSRKKQEKSSCVIS